MRWGDTLRKGPRTPGTLRSAAATLARVAAAAAVACLVAWAVSRDPHWAERHVLASYCATGPAGWLVARAWPWLSGVLCGAAVLGLLRGLSRWRARATLRGRAGALAGIAVAVAASLLVGELYVRRLHARLTGGEGAPDAARELAMTRADPRLGWSYVPGRTTVVRMGERLVTYAIGADGDRIAPGGPAPDPEAPSVLFTGESIAFGYGLPYEESFPALVGRGMGVQTVNLSVIGYGNDQAYLRLVDALARYRHPVAVVTVFIPEQVKRNADVWRRRLALAPDGALVAAEPARGPRLSRLLQELPFHSGEALRVTAAILRETADAARARGAFPLVVVTNYRAACLHGEGDEPWIVDELLVRQGLPYVRVDLGPEDRLPGSFESHPNLHGTRRIAAAVERALAEAGETAGERQRMRSTLQTPAWSESQ